MPTVGSTPTLTHTRFEVLILYLKFNLSIDSYGYCLLQYCHSSQFSTHSSNRRTNVLSGLDAGSVDGRFSSKYCFITVLQPFQISTHSSNRRTNVLSGLDAGSVDGRLQQ